MISGLPFVAKSLGHAVVTFSLVVLLVSSSDSSAQTALQPAKTGTNIPSASVLDPRTAEIQKKLNALIAKGQVPEAVKLALEQVVEAESTSGTNHLNTADALDRLGQIYEGAGQHTNALPVYTRSFKIRTATAGMDAPATITTLHMLARTHFVMGDTATAKQLNETCLKLREKNLGPDHPDVAKSLNNLGLIYGRMNDTAMEEAMYKRSVSIAEKSLGEGDPSTRLYCGNLANLYYRKKEYGQAAAMFERVLRMKQNAFGAEHLDVAATFHDLGNVYRLQQESVKAIDALSKSLAIREKVLGPKHRDVATTLYLLGFVHLYGREDYSKAEPLLLRSLRIREEVLPANNLDTASALEVLGALYMAVGDTTKAEPLLVKGMKIRELMLPPNDIDTIRMAATLGWLKYTRGEYAEAESLYRRNLKGLEETMGADHPTTIAPLSLLAELLMAKKDYMSAEPMFKRVIGAMAKIPGLSPETVSVPLAGLGNLYMQTGDYPNAERYLEQAVTGAEAVQSEAVGNIYGELSLVKLKLGKLDQARAFAQKQKARDIKKLDNVLALSSEQDRLTYGATQNPYALYAELDDASGLADAVLRHKGIVLDSLLEDRLIFQSSKDPTTSNLLMQLSTERRNLQQLSMSINSATTSLVEKAELKVESLEREMASRITGYGQARHALKIKVTDVQARLSDHTVLVEYFEYVQRLERGQLQPRYGVVLIPAPDTTFRGANRGEPVWVPLGRSVEIEQNLKIYGEVMRGGRKGDETVLRTLYTQLVEPIQKFLPTGTHTLIIAPGSDLNFLNFGTLIGADGTFLAEKLSVKHIASGRDLLAQSSAKQSGPSLVAFANPAFTSRVSEATKSKAVDVVTNLQTALNRSFQDLNLQALPGTEEEIAAIKRTAPGWNVQQFIGTAATEAEVLRVRSPRILHIATHGFFLSEPALTNGLGTLAQKVGDRGSVVKISNPMMRSGLALAGAQTTLEAWKRGEIPNPDNDGILMAQEVGLMDLRNTWLVVLSACDTGVGEARSGEGVMGLRRGFVQAGTQNLLMTLWPISDRVTVEIMKSFYDKAMSTGDAPQAMADVQSEWLAKLRKEKGVVIAARLAGPFILTSRGQPSKK